MRRDGVEKLREHVRLDAGTPRLDQPEPEMHVAEKPALRRGSERRPPTELAHASHVVQERGAEEKIVTETRVQLCGLTTEGGDADRVLEQATRVPVMPVGSRRGEGAETGTNAFVAEHPARQRPETGIETSAVRNSRNPSSSSASRRSAGARPDGSTAAGSSVGWHL